jgi:hypothetical protein
MRRGALKHSELIQNIGCRDGNMEIKYRDDGAVFVLLRGSVYDLPGAEAQQASWN